MMEAENSQVQHHHIATVDRISNLPWVLLDNILGRVPLKEVMRTSILSRQWRYYWIKLSKLIFDESCEIDSDDRRAVEHHFLYLVYFVLMANNSRPIQSFSLSPSSRIRFHQTDISNWIEFLWRGSRDFIKRISLQLHASSGWKLRAPSCLFSCHQLTHLSTSFILLKLPNSFSVLRNLIHLQLHSFATSHIDNTVDAEAFANLIRNCPALENLDLTEFIMLDPFVIEAPKLKYLCLWGSFQAIVFENCPLIKDISLIKVDKDIKLDEVQDFRIDQLQGQGKLCNLFENPALVSRLKCLELSGYFLKYLHVRDALGTIFPASNKLSDLTLHEISLRQLNEVEDALAILKLFPYIEDLYISIQSDDHLEESNEIINKLIQSSCSFQALQDVKIETSSIDENGVPESYWRPELELIKLVLARSPVLEKMTVVGDRSALNHEKVFLRNMLFFERASEQAKFSFYYM